jgi:para-nitrobenzyl esterase
MADGAGGRAGQLYGALNILYQETKISVFLFYIKFYLQGETYMFKKNKDAFNMMRKAAAVTIAAAVLILCSACGTTSAGRTEAVQSGGNLLTVKTSYGPVTGTEEAGVRIWYGIPYGKTPAGALRWQAPQSPDAWKEPLSCTASPAPALQISGKNITGTEDCLRLTVYSAEGSRNQPVFVYIHGGNNQTGTSGEIPGTELAKKAGCVYVSVDYRLGLLGFNCLPSLQKNKGDTGNYSMLDIAAALDWIKNNIRQFGGNPGNITISGFSAGGRDVMAMLISPLFKNKFQKAVVFSGGMTTADVPQSSAKIAAAVAPLAVADGKASDNAAAQKWLLTDGDDVKTYLYSISSARLAALMGNAGIRMSVFPHLYRDGVVIPDDGFDTDDYNSVPLMMLTGSTEFSLFCQFDGYFAGTDMSSYTKEQIDAAKNFATVYGSDMYRIFNAQCSAEKMYSNYKSNIYICQINYGSRESMSHDTGSFGAFHGIFVPMLSSKNNYSGMFKDVFSRPGYTAMAEQYTGYLANFLRSGNPNGTGLAAWSSWTPEQKNSMVFDATESAAVIKLSDVSTTYEKIMDTMDSDTSIPPDMKKQVIAHVLNGRWFSGALDARYQNADMWKY